MASVVRLLATALLVTTLLYTAGQAIEEPSKEDCRPHIQKEKEACEARAGGGEPAASSGPLAAVMDVVFAESRLMRQRDLAIAARERDLIRYKVESGLLPTEALDEPLPSEVTAQQPSLLAKLWGAVFSEARLLRLRQEAMEARADDLRRLKLQRGDVVESFPANLELPEVPQELESPPTAPRTVSWVASAARPPTPTSGSWLYDLLFAEVNYLKLRDQAIADREQDLVRAKVERGELPPEALNNRRLSSPEAALAAETPGLWDTLFPESRHLAIRRRAMAERQRDLIMTQVERGDLPASALDQLPQQHGQTAQRPGILTSLWDSVFSEGRLMEIRRAAMAERHRSLVRAKVERGELPASALNSLDVEEAAVDQQTLLQKVWGLVFAEGRYMAQRNEAIAAREADLRRVKEAIARGEDPRPAVDATAASDGGSPVASADNSDADGIVETDTSDDDDDDEDDDDEDDEDHDEVENTAAEKDGREAVERAAREEAAVREMRAAAEREARAAAEREAKAAAEREAKAAAEREARAAAEREAKAAAEREAKAAAEREVRAAAEREARAASEREAKAAAEREAKAAAEREAKAAAEIVAREAVRPEVFAEDTVEANKIPTHDEHEDDEEEDDDSESDGEHDPDAAATDARRSEENDNEDEGTHHGVEPVSEPVETYEPASPLPSASTAPVVTTSPPSPVTATPTVAEAPAVVPIPAPVPHHVPAPIPAPTAAPIPVPTAAPAPTATPAPPSTPTARPRTEVEELLGLRAPFSRAHEDATNYALRELKRVADSAIKPLEQTYKYDAVSSRSLGDSEIFAKPVILFLGQLNSGKSTMINYLLGTDATRTTAMPGSGQFRVLSYGDTEQAQDGGQVTALWEFAGLQKFGEAFLERLSGRQLKHRLLEKVNIVDVPGIMEGRQYSRIYPFNDVCQWFIDRADIIFVVFDPHHLDIGVEMENLLDQLKGRETQVRIILNKADQVPASSLLHVQGGLIWSLSPLLGSTSPPAIYSGSFISQPYQQGAPADLFRSQEDSILRDIATSIAGRVDNKIALARRHAVRVRNHARMVDCYVTTFLNQQTFLSNKKKLSDDVISNPHKYHIYEGISRVTNISRYDLPDPEVYEDFFTIHPLYDFPTLASTCTYFKGCPLDQLDSAISHDLPQLLGTYRKKAGKTSGRKHG